MLSWWYKELHGETECYLMVIFTMGELVLLSVCVLCTLYSPLVMSPVNILLLEPASDEYRVQRRHTDSKTNSPIVNITIR